jgi:hypothetical protein
MKMDAQDFKTKYPHLSHLEGNDLWNAMEDAWIYEHKDDKPKEVTDWKGNVIKEGDEVCFIKIRTGGFFKNFGWMIPNGDGTYTSHTIPDVPDEDCWEFGEYKKVWANKTGKLFYTSVLGEYILHQPISMLNFCGDSKHILAIKGVSDNRS